MVEPRVDTQVVDGAARAGLRIEHAEHDAVDPRREQASGAHRARFDGDHDSRALQPPTVPDGPCRVAYGEKLGVRGRVARALSLVVPARDYIAIHQYDGPDGNVAVNQCAGRFLEGDPHRSRGVHLPDGNAERQPAR